MNKKHPDPLPKPLIKVQKQLNKWRSSQQTRARIPNDFWTTAVKLSQAHGMSKTAKALGLDYSTLKKRAEGISESVTKHPEKAFVEVFPSEYRISLECVIELESEDKTKMRISLKGSSLSDFAEFTTRLWKRQS